MLRRFEIEVREVDNFDDLVIFAVELQNVATGYERFGIEKPQWLTEKLREAETELTVRVRTRKERRLTELRLRRESLLTADEKRAKVDREIADLEKELVPTPSAATASA